MIAEWFQINYILERREMYIERKLCICISWPGRERAERLAQQTCVLCVNLGCLVLKEHQCEFVEVVHRGYYSAMGTSKSLNFDYCKKAKKDSLLDKL